MARGTRRSFLIEAGAWAVATNRLALAAPKKSAFDNFKAITHARQWCDKTSNPCGQYFNADHYSDCAHFIAHCLAAGGLKINAASGPSPCPQGLAVRNTDLVAALRKLISDGNVNVAEIGLSDAIVGDIGFLDTPLRPYHAFMICSPVDLRITPPPAVKVWAHSTARCCEAMDAQWKQWFSTAFRITDYKP